MQARQSIGTLETYAAIAVPKPTLAAPPAKNMGRESRTKLATRCTSRICARRRSAPAREAKRPFASQKPGVARLIVERRTTERGRPKVQSVDRTLDVLEALATRRSATGISELAQIVGLHVSTVHRLLATLVDRGYVRQDPESSRYHLGSRIFTLSSAADIHLDLRLVARPYLERMMRHSGETANLVTASDREVVYLDQVASMHLVKMFTAPGMRVPFYCTGTGKAILAFKPLDFVESVLQGPFKRYTPHTHVSRAAIEKELAQIRRLGYSVDNEEMEEGVRCLAVPIFDRRRQVVGALSVSGPTTRMTLERVDKLASNARAIADELSRQLGFESELPIT
jgi:DNA-binding IclR family transcriptional regulator